MPQKPSDKSLAAAPQQSEAAESSQSSGGPRRFRDDPAGHIRAARTHWAAATWVQRARRALPFGFFVGGFLFDALTLGRLVTFANLLVVGLYAVGAAICLVILGRFSPALTPVIPPREDGGAEGQGLSEGALVDAPRPPNTESKWLRGVKFGLNFCLGSLFSALVILYFKSAGGWLTFLTVSLLFAGMVFNEFARLGESQRHLSWGIFCVSLVMLLNFVLPHLMGSISAWWFYISTAVAIGLVWALNRLAGNHFRMIRSALGAAGVLVLLFIMGWVPPVPLVLKHSLVGRDYKKVDGEYSCLVDQQTLLSRAGLSAPRVSWAEGEQVDMLTAIFAPRGIEVDMEHRWYQKVDGAWAQTDTIPFHIRGGRQKGWRMRSAKRNLAPGLWRVETALAGGTALGHQTFRVEIAGEERPARRENL